MNSEALAHIEWLAGRADPVMCWQLFDDKKKDHSKAKCFHGRLPEVLDRLNAAQAESCGVYISVNATDGYGRKKENISACRAVFLDFDNAPLPTAWPVEPGLSINSSPGKFQAWWRLQPTQDFDAWTALHIDLAARYGADPKCTMTTQVGRLAGFMHLKGEPFRVRIVSGPRKETHSLADLAAAFGIDLEDAKVRHAERLKPPQATFEEPPGGWDHDVDIERAKGWLAVEENWWKANSGGMSVFKVACRLRDYGLSPGMCEELIEEFIPAMPDEADGDIYYARKKVERAFKYAKGEFGSRSIAADLDAFDKLMDSQNDDA